MAHFYGEIQGNRGTATRTGSKNSGIRAHIRGWEVGVKVYIEHDEKTGKDKVFVYKTSGSNGRESDELIAEFTE